jgi:hypothetical protein
VPGFDGARSLTPQPAQGVVVSGRISVTLPQAGHFMRTGIVDPSKQGICDFEDNNSIRPRDDP